MGTVQSVAASTKIAANVVQNTAQDCINVAYGGNVFNVNGNFNDISGVSQTVSVSINSNCAAFQAQKATFDAALQNAISQTLSDQEVALTQWMNTSGVDQSTYIAENMKANFTQNNIQKCVSSLNGYNIFNVMGSGNVVKDVTQNATLSMLSQCIMQNQQTSQSVATITNTANQHTKKVVKNPLDFIPDALNALAKGPLMLLAIVFIVLICLVAGFKFLTGGSGGSSLKVPAGLERAAALAAV